MPLSQRYNDLILLVGRLLFSFIFILAGLGKVMNFATTAQGMAANGVPLSEVMLVIAIIMELGGGLMVLLGFKARLGALLIFLFILPVTLMFHAFWSFEGAMAVNHMQHLLKNVALMGGALFLMSSGAGRYSMDRK